jgi:hypothetical protein
MTEIQQWGQATRESYDPTSRHRPVKTNIREQLDRKNHLILTKDQHILQLQQALNDVRPHVAEEMRATYQRAYQPMLDHLTTQLLDVTHQLAVAENKIEEIGYSTSLRQKTSEVMAEAQRQLFLSNPVVDGTILTLEKAQEDLVYHQANDDAELRVRQREIDIWVREKKLDIAAKTLEMEKAVYKVAIEEQVRVEIQAEYDERASRRRNARAAGRAETAQKTTEVLNPDRIDIDTDSDEQEKKQDKGKSQADPVKPDEAKLIEVEDLMDFPSSENEDKMEH